MARTARIIQRNAILQVAILFACWLTGEALARLTGLPVPGSIIGLAIAIILLTSRRLSVVSMRKGANLFLADLLLFFVPAVLAVLEHRELFGLLGLKVLFVILTSTVLVMLATVFTVERAIRWSMNHHG
ncbi:CidA/LrgA family protein [Altericroceibacterium spongiae]|uniref:CidA/LrgA family protein n=1 Tax=Altericroceibacterium spongiae TaxID=2320269 RepID=A0A420ES64_9SPHN|nr:CidA/LrgA family protein [Altericroceibacterium spongiae]RKF23512.1 CidA/LrgA family protein [Altericroceibacterium spongiae]